MPKIVAQVPEDIYRNINEEIKLGVFVDEAEAIVSALKKTYAKKSRTFLKWLMKKEDITESAILKEIETLRK